MINQQTRTRLAELGRFVCNCNRLVVYLPVETFTKLKTISKERDL